MNEGFWVEIFDYIHIIVGLEIALLIAIIVAVVYFLKHRKPKGMKKQASLPPRKIVSLQDLLAEDEKKTPGQPTHVALEDGEYVVEKTLTLFDGFHIKGNGVAETKLVSTGEHPALCVKDAKDCVVSNIRIEGSIQCSNSEILLDNCHIVAKDNGICIEAFEGSIVTFSGLMRGEGGIAIRAHGESQVILKPPYAVSGDDYVVIDPKSEITLEKKAEETDSKKKTD